MVEDTLKIALKREKKENIPTIGTETTKIGRKRTRNLEARRKKEIDAYRRAVLHPTFSQQEELCSKKKRESATVRTERSRTITHSKRTTKKSSVRLRRSSKRNLEKFPLEKYPLSKHFRIALLLSHKNCESIYTACYD